MAKPIHASQDAIHAEGNSLSRCLHLDKLHFEAVGRNVAQTTLPQIVQMAENGFLIDFV